MMYQTLPYAVTFQRTKRKYTRNTKMCPSTVTVTTTLVVMSFLVLCPANAFSFSDCMRNGQYNSDNVIHVHEAQIHPSTVVAPGTLWVNIDFEILRNVPRDLELSVTVQKKVWLFWIVGHRSTHSLCDVLNTAFLEADGTTACPSQLANAGIPCRCPFRRGRYNLPWTTFDVTKPDDIPYGNYWVTARLRDPNTGELKGCHEVGVHLARY
ncbi:ganglioside GM2 activator-like [Pecten maximus]|uniref:ganglioside GM2 activator-like n=1 Tax=Pecten maximus TaxID=6579 RepID=UPI0014591922|nr:ganglioside GM2 activator-like [Pecten maximus]